MTVNVCHVSFSGTVSADDVVKVINEYLTKETYDAVETAVMSHDIKRKMVPELVKEMVYAHKEDIIEQIVSRATTELVKKGLPKLLERMDASD